jgi:NADPH-dependent curcumin reductase
MPQTNRQWRLAARPQGKVTPADFSWQEEPLADPAQGQFLARNIYLSLDPTNRVWMNEADSYLPAIPLGQVMRGGTIALVEKSRNPGFQEGDLIQGLGGWQDYVLSDGAFFSKLPKIPGMPLTAWYGAMGHIGFTAYFGIFDVGKPKPGETIVVSAAAGAVGSLAGQMGKIAGCTVVGIAGSDDKCKWITGELGFDAAINYKKDNVRDALKKNCPKGIDVDFENVGGAIMEAVIDRLNLGARIALCGMISQYNESKPAGPANFASFIMKRVICQGFLVTDYANRFPEAVGKILGWIAEGKLKYKIDMVDGLGQAPTALSRLFDGANTGKLLVKISEEPA